MVYSNPYNPNNKNAVAWLLSVCCAEWNICRLSCEIGKSLPFSHRHRHLNAGTCFVLVLTSLVNDQNLKSSSPSPSILTYSAIFFSDSSRKATPQTSSQVASPSTWSWGPSIGLLTFSLPVCKILGSHNFNAHLPDPTITLPTLNFRE